MANRNRFDFSRQADESPLLSTRKRARPRVGADGDTTAVQLPEPDIDDPDYLELLKVYDEDDDAEVERERESMRAEAMYSTPLTQGAIYFFILVGVALFVLLVNWYNVRQLERLKVEYGLDGEKTLPADIWWGKALMYRIYVHSFKDSNEDGIGDLEGGTQCCLMTHNHS